MSSLRSSPVRRRANGFPSHSSVYLGAQNSQNRVFLLVEDACAKLSWRIEHCHVPGDQIQLGLHGLFAKVAMTSCRKREAGAAGGSAG
ncbi:hypothetical protein THAOC_07637 [Thalassiosira oceanica]|uniref:Uncharacterized protein n=1 Tax=Thalassiosira oceanica TaxID=159749 RepID=K0TBX4_THAOC|nr:hypothetical protein THAOC_07637 [Thalassiosira oceanica]|eukprot:EJK70961.1 hypothetical protein THAOC_07637 [Thalassiosira oceanica]